MAIKITKKGSSETPKLPDDELAAIAAEQAAESVKAAAEAVKRQTLDQLGSALAALPLAVFLRHRQDISLIREQLLGGNVERALAIFEVMDVSGESPETVATFQTLLGNLGS